MNRNRFLLIPFFVVGLAFVIDKLLLMEKVQTYFSKTMSEVNYFHKPHLFKQLKQYLKQPERKKVLVYFGSSRGLLFDNKYIARHYPGWILFNFSVPGGTPDYFYFWLEQFEKEHVKPDFILLDNSIEAYNLDAQIKLDEVLVNGLTLPFVIRYAGRYTERQFTNFIAKRMFRTYQYRPNLKTVIGRMKNDFEVLTVYRKWREKIRVRLKEERGSATSDLSQNATSPPEVIRKYSEGNFQSYMNPFRFNQDMLFFLEGSVKIAKKMAVQHAIIWVRIAPHYLYLIQTKPVLTLPARKKETVYTIWTQQLNPVYNRQAVDFWNMNEAEDYHCDDFTDASHMASSCYPDYTDFIFTRMGVPRQ